MMMGNIFLQKELQISYNSPNSYGILSRLVCQHQSKHPEFSSSQIQQSLDRTEKVFNATYTFWKELKSKGIFHTDIFWYFEPFAWVTQMKKIFGDGTLCPYCGKIHISLTQKIDFSHQVGQDDCKKRCDIIIAKLNIESEGATGKHLPNKRIGAFYQLALEKTYQEGKELN